MARQDSKSKTCWVWNSFVFPQFRGEILKRRKTGCTPLPSKRTSSSPAIVPVKLKRSKSGTILVKRRTKQFWNQNSRPRSGLTLSNPLWRPFVNEKGPIHNAARNPKQEFRNVAKESPKDTPTRNPKQEFQNFARDTAAKNPKQEFRNVAKVVPAIEYAGRHVEKGNKTLRTKNESESMSVVIFHDADVKNKTRDSKRLTSKKNKGKETLHLKDEKKIC